ncbi:MAG: 7-cyano-7-deazaguanine synthase QueC [Synergistaceae bacterium]
MKVVISLSGGMDSTTVVGLCHHLGHEIIPVMFSYGSKHNPYENEAAVKVAGYYGLREIHKIDLTEAMAGFKSNLLKSGGDIPEGHYESESMSATVVPGRNTIFLSMLMGYAESIGAEAVAIGVHAGDHHIYPDCRPEFIQAMMDVYKAATEGKVALLAPFLYDNKTSILEQGYSYEKPAPYALTRTCYKDQPVSCGKCGSCQERLEAYRNFGIDDPIQYETREALPKEDTDV